MLGKAFGGMIRGVWWLGQRAWSHPVLRLVILGLVAVWLLPAWYRTAGWRGAWTVGGIAEIWWLLVADTLHHVYPLVGRWTWIGYVVILWPWVATLVGGRWLAAGVVTVVVVGILLVKYFTNSKKGVGTHGGVPS